MFSCFGLLKLLLNGCRRNDDSFINHQIDSLEFPLTRRNLRNYRTNRQITTNDLFPPNDSDKIGFRGDFSSVRNINITIPPKSLDIIPRSTGILDGDWILRCSDSEASIHPWREQKTHHNFDLVPWKRQPGLKTSFESFSWASKEQNRILKRLHTLEHKQTHKQIKKRLSNDEKVRKRIRVKVIFTFELRQKKMEVLTPKFVTRSFHQQFYQHRIREVPSVFSQETFKKHLGYFTQREKENFYEQLENDIKLSGLSWSSNKFFNEKTINKYKKVNSHKSFNQSEVQKKAKNNKNINKNEKHIDLQHSLCAKCTAR
jgi:hypothetical protein